ncbi:jg18775 [Pararge aegeria aegeria]|uniref:Jg18775 protein n=1 Tax=Pararge aegeria aegeria TaxID=348720 RepID=A0A8S4SD77_9NEOP|nr:jg18775 [Pararge aegeria aegeria]
MKPKLFEGKVDDEKLITSDNTVRKRSWSVRLQRLQNPGLSRNNDDDGIGRELFHYELLSGRTIDSDLYCQQRMRLKQEVEIKRSKSINRKPAVFQHDKARLHTSQHSLSHSLKIKRVYLGGDNASAMYL